MNFWTAFKYSVLTAVVFTWCSTTANAVQVSDKHLKEVEQQVFEKSMEHKKLQAQATQISMELSEVNRMMIQTAKNLQNNEEKLSDMERQLVVLEKKLAELETSFSKDNAHLIKTLTSLQNLAMRPTESLLVQPLKPVDVIRSAMILRETIPHLESNAGTLRKELLAIKDKKNQIENQIRQISKQKKVMSEEQKRISLLLKKKFNLRNLVEIKSEKAKKNVDKLASQAQDLRDLLAKLEKQRLEKEKQERERRQREAEERRKLEEKQSDDLIKSKSTGITNVVSGFEKAKGSLPLPARGQIITKYGEQKARGILAKGITIASRNQAQVVSPFDGNVVFSGPFRGYGNMIIIEHGDGYLSLLSGFETVNVELGQMLLAGEPIAQMPVEGKSELYVEIRKNNQPINPAAWFKI
ncbi:MAG: hypothetical protein E7004_01350 [Alphaproteobacteria bacterium]|nr:hypothetical protein [Alphaproteobacteria bacterium]